MLAEAISLGSLGLFSAVGLGLAAKFFAVKQDPLVQAIEEALPGANCGGCGFAGCSGAAAAIAKGLAPVNVCVGGGPEVGLAVAAIMGVEPGFKEPEFAKPKCRYGEEDAETKFIYSGIQDCRAAMLLSGGAKVCEIGCLGLGSCVRACPFEAIAIGPDGLPVVDEKKCTGCGTCERICPKHIISVTSASKRILALNQQDDCLAPCQQTCPAQINIPEYISQISQGNYEQAVRVIKEKNPLPLTCGRVCPHPCEAKCRRGTVDEPVNINHLKRFAADYELLSGKAFDTFTLPKNGHKVAIVGGGPGGLSAAFYLARMGYECTIFEAMPKLGGMLRYGIPEYRLPKKTLDWEIQAILDLGVSVEYNKVMGEDFTIDSLKKDGFEAIFLAAGAWGSRLLGVEGEDVQGVLPGTSFLIDRGLEKETPVGQRVVIVGGGNTAIDAARTSWRLGAKEVTVLYRRSRKEMPANDIEVEEAEHEGIKFHFLAAPTRLVGENGKLTGIEFIKMELGEPDASGRRRPVPVEGSETVLPVDNVIAAIGQFPDLDFIQKTKDGLEKDVKVTRWKTVEAKDTTMDTSVPGVFAGGDVVSGPQTVVEAIGAGRRAARSIHQYVATQSMEAPANLINAKDIMLVMPENVPPAPRVKMAELNVEQRRLNFEEVDLGLTEDQARAESKRCLTCGRYCYKPNAAA
ncbi:MAG: RnfABCDGE type electron transport complex subunit B [Deltaproteobacteria bacterium]|nr:RnfABCDGE type electron transport complex subunit B [Deltaproteobacteria bacterium]